MHLGGIFFTGGDVPVDRFVVTSSISRSNPPAQFIGGAHRRVRVRAFLVPSRKNIRKSALKFHDFLDSNYVIYHYDFIYKFRGKYDNPCHVDSSYNGLIYVHVFVGIALHAISF